VKHACPVMAVQPRVSFLPIRIPGLALRYASPGRVVSSPNRVFHQRRPARARLAAHPQHAALACANSISQRGQRPEGLRGTAPARDRVLRPGW
jgi:hypothetical protein